MLDRLALKVLLVFVGVSTMDAAVRRLNQCGVRSCALLRFQILQRSFYVPRLAFIFGEIQRQNVPTARYVIGGKNPVSALERECSDTGSGVRDFNRVFGPGHPSVTGFRSPNYR